MKENLVTLITVIGLTVCTNLAFAETGDNQNNQRNERRGPPQFSELDLNGNSAITLDEFSQHQVPRGDHETIFNHIDTDGDGTITEEELLAHKPPRRPRN